MKPLTDQELADVAKLCEQYRANAGERLGSEAFTALQQGMLYTLPRLVKEVQAARGEIERLKAELEEARANALEDVAKAALRGGVE